MHPKIFTVTNQHRKLDTLRFLMIPILIVGGGCTVGDAGPRPKRYFITEEDVNICSSEILKVNVFPRTLLEQNYMRISILIENISSSRNCYMKTSNVKTLVTSRCVRRSVMSACGHNGTPGTSRCVRHSVMSAMDFHRSVVSACGHNGTTGTSRYVRRSVMSADNFRDSLYLEYTPSKTYFSTWFIKIKYDLDVYMTNFWCAQRKYEITMWALPIVPFGSSVFIADFFYILYYVYTFIVQISNQFLLLMDHALK